MNDPVALSKPPPAPAEPPRAPAPPPPSPQPVFPRLVSRWRRWANEWGLRLLALVLAVLVWALVRTNIAVQPDPIFRIDVRVDAQDPARFVGFHIPSEAGQPRVTLKGPRAEVDQAREVLGSPPTIGIRAVTLDPGEDRREERLSYADNPTRFVLGGVPRRVIQSIDPITIETFRLEDQSTTIALPKLENVEPGWNVKIELSETEPVVKAPADKLGKRIDPDPIDVRAWFDRAAAARAEGIDPRPLERVLTFNAWRNDVQEARYRREIDLPAITARIVFFPELEQSFERDFEKFFVGEFSVLGGRPEEVYTIDVNTPGLDLSQNQTRLRATFRGSRADLAALEASQDWFYGVLIPAETLAQFEDHTRNEVVLQAELQWFPGPEALQRLPVQFVVDPSAQKLQITVRRRPLN